MENIERYDLILDELINYVDNLSEDTKKQFINYTGSSYEKLNKKMRKNKALNEEQHYMIRHMDMAFRFAPVLKEPIVVYRGVRKEYNQTLISYVSTTLDIDQAISFSGTISSLLKILIPAGSKVLPIYTISSVPQELEILIDRHGDYTVTSITEPFDYPKTYDIMYIPPIIMPFEIQTINEPKKEFDIDFYVSRLLDNIDDEELELLGVEETIYLIAESMSNIPQQAIDIAIDKLKK